jgi:hypothetical protein
LTRVPATLARLALALEAMPYRIKDDRGNKKPRKHVECDKQRKICGTDSTCTPDESGSKR